MNNKFGDIEMDERISVPVKEIYDAHQKLVSFIDRKIITGEEDLLRAKNCISYFRADIEIIQQSVHPMKEISFDKDFHLYRIGLIRILRSKYDTGYCEGVLFKE